MINTLISSFNSGELSPKLWNRVDLDKYGSGCRTLENFITMPYGGINRRPGTQFISEVKDSTKKARLIGFNFSVTTNFVLEFGNQYIRFYSNGAQILSGGNPYEISSPYLEADLFELQYCQINDVMYIAHANYPVYKLSRLADDNWTLAAVEWDYPPFRDENITATTITPSATTGNGITLTASSSIFTADNVGGYYRIGTRRATSSIKIALTANGNSDTMAVLGKWEFTTSGKWKCTILVEASYDKGSTWETVRSFYGDQDRNIITTGTQTRDCLMRLRVADYSSSVAPTYAYLDAVEATVYGVVKITGYTSGTVVTGNVVKDLHTAAAGTATKHWAEGEWSTRRGFPRSVTLHQQRLFFGGSKSNAVRIWGSTTGDFENFLVTTFDDGSLSLTLSAVEQNIINWILSYKNSLVIGTSGDEFVLSPATGAVLSPTNLDIQRNSRFGSAYIPAALVNNAVIYTQRHGRKLQELFYNFQTENFISQDLTLLAEHVTYGGVIQHAFQQQLDSTFWVVTGQGILAGMTYDRNQNVVSWHRHTTDGSFESVSSIYGATTSGDEVWVIVKRTIGGNTKRYVERFDPNYRDTLDLEQINNWFYVDCGKQVVNGSPSDTVTGLSHLNGKTVAILADGAVHPSKTVSGGQITLDRTATTVAVGLPYTSTLKPTSFDPGQLQNGTAQGRHFRVHRLGIRFYKSLGGEVETMPGQFDPIPFRGPDTKMDESPGAFTGQKDVHIAGDFALTADVTLRQSQPLPMSILSLIPRFDVYGD